MKTFLIILLTYLTFTSCDSKKVSNYGKPPFGALSFAAMKDVNEDGLNDIIIFEFNGDGNLVASKLYSSSYTSNFSYSSKWWGTGFKYDTTTVHQYVLNSDGTYTMIEVDSKGRVVKESEIDSTTWFQRKWKSLFSEN